MRAAPVSELVETTRARKRDVAGNVQFDAWCELKTAPDRSLGRRGHSMGRALDRGAAKRGFDVIERPPRCLKRFNFEQAVEMRLAVVTAPSNAERRGNQTLLNVIPHRASGDIAQVGQILDGEPYVGAHRH